MDQQKLGIEFLIFTKAQGLTRDHPFSIKLKTECIWASSHNFSNSLDLQADSSALFRIIGLSFLSL